MSEEQKNATQEATEETKKQKPRQEIGLGESYSPQDTPGAGEDNNLLLQERWKSFFNSDKFKNQLDTSLDANMKEKVIASISSFISDPSQEDEHTKNVLATFANCRQPGISSEDDKKVTVHVNAILRQFHLLYEENEHIMQGIRD